MIPEPQTEAAHKQDWRESIAKIAKERNVSDEQVQRWCQKHLGCSYAEASVDGLMELHAALKAKAA